MPYVSKRVRDSVLHREQGGYVRDVGNLNYILTTVCLDYLLQHGMKYQTINDILGALRGVELEFYRKVAARYEDRKCAENGDVFPAEEDW